MNEQIFMLLVQNEGPGGLFDINATLPLVAIQFLILMFILNKILYDPLTTFMYKRDQYTMNNLRKASKILIKAEKWNQRCDKIVSIVKTYDTNNYISKLNESDIEEFTNELNSWQNEIDLFVQEVLSSFLIRRESITTYLTPEIELLSEQINLKIFNENY
jgi:F-type H+-transporting ATPase subunit b